ncbi:gamma-glutamyltransferase family protein [Patulibacter brassicae]|uniref:Gamma-glutamyltransferase family protein n=1 Tax=Patulibacter brassicae TaxID=1705717 RepID=A0ABU4VJ46_9ACTN|nr:gamma-glutamyltransferase family protein [Patulibacter brassicae]MDX8151856.1 gamma-glutamyltransferase family protein [Patulibacter brassicae]
MPPRPLRPLPLAAALCAAATLPTAATADGPPVATGSGGAVASVDADATKAGLAVLRAGGNAVDAAVATAAALGVTEPYSAGVGGGGYLVLWDARRKSAVTIDGRETAPRSLGPRGFLDPATGKARPFDELVTSGLSVGVPGTPATWERAVRRYGRLSLARVLRGPARLAQDGFVVDRTFRDQTAQNAERFARFRSSRALFLPGGAPHAVGTRLRNPELARTYRSIGRHGAGVVYRGAIGDDVARTVRNPPVVPGQRVLRGGLRRSDLRSYAVRERGAVRSRFRGLDVLGMPPSSSGGIAVAEALNVVEALGPPAAARTTFLHRYLSASRLAFADRNRWVGDDRFVRVPRGGLISERFAQSRACLVSPTRALAHPQPAGDPAVARGRGPLPCPGGGEPEVGQPREGESTTHLVAADRWGNVVSYTLTIEQTGGSGIVVPGRGFLLNNELTDFNPEPLTGLDWRTDPNLPAPGKRPRSSMSPTLVLRDGRPWLAVGSPGGATIITTVLQTLLQRIDGGMSLPQAVAAPRLSQRNAASTEAEPAFLATPERAALEALGHRFVTASTTFTPDPEIGAVAALERRGSRWQAVAEPTRRGGGSAGAIDR